MGLRAPSPQRKAQQQDHFQQLTACAVRGNLARAKVFTDVMVEVPLIQKHGSHLDRVTTKSHEFPKASATQNKEQVEGK